MRLLSLLHRIGQQVEWDFGRYGKNRLTEVEYSVRYWAKRDRFFIVGCTAYKMDGASVVISQPRNRA